MTEEISLSMEDPRDAAGATLIAEMKTFIARLYPEDTDEAPPPWTIDDLASQGFFCVARADGSPVGCGGLVPIGLDGMLEIVRMYVRAGHRGRRIADRLLTELERSAKARGVDLLMLRCGPRQPEALRFYERNGYERRPVFAYHRDHAATVFYEKRLVGK